MSQRIQDRCGRWWRAEYEPPGGASGGASTPCPEMPRVRGRIVFRGEDNPEIRECGTGEEFGIALANGSADEMTLLGALATATVR